MPNRRAECSCGQLAVETTSEPVRISICHCLACQRRTGSVFGAQARFAEEQVRSTGRSTEYAHTADSGHKIRFFFCPDCGSTVFYKLDQLPGFIAVPVGAFADPGFPEPTVSVYETRRHLWAGVPEGAEHVD